MKEEVEEEEAVVNDDEEAEAETKNEANAAKKLKLRITTWLVVLQSPREHGR